MPNNSYLRSRKREQELVREYRKMDWYACRSAGSKSPYDVWAVNPRNGEVHLTQIKTEKGGRKMTRTVLLQIGDVTCYLLRFHV